MYSQDRAWRAASSCLMNVISVLNDGRQGSVYHSNFPSPWTNGRIWRCRMSHLDMLPTFPDELYSFHHALSWNKPLCMILYAMELATGT